MFTNNVLVNDTVRIKVYFLDTDPQTNQQVEVSPISVNVKIYNGKSEEIVSTTAVSLTASQYYYDFTPLVEDQYKITFIGVLANNSTITVDQNLYVSSRTSEYKPVVTLGSTETIYFCTDMNPLYIDPEEILSYYPEASLMQLGEIIHNYSSEVAEIYGSANTEIQTGSLNFTALEYIKAATACEMSRTYGYGSGDDEQSIRIGDLQISNRNSPRRMVSRSNAVTWCQIAIALRSEMIAHKVGAKGVVFKGTPSANPMTSTYDPITDTAVYLGETGLFTMGTNGNGTIDPNSGDHYVDPDRTLRKYD